MTAADNAMAPVLIRLLLTFLALLVRNHLAGQGR